ncbi:chitoporin ChiP [Klebsiella quasipneumoniae]|uniref:chitoporin ChiP n=1 Tax=Klebsiella quasipneumoniae TaxID=1463165 RepID=UPI000C7A9B62|nr:chitoporin [Klebsiella quasipneumoniae]MBR7424044.1 chitoporin [Klebsiella quasipneumoniae]MBR7457592.1 chitoporin [Klebsiella quasipneumoniae]PLF85655.1 chitoporin [Klebsiella quasipneumoniae]PLJ71695.1 chitoporin [Klebsiella quasipneumoniae]
MRTFSGKRSTLALAIAAVTAMSGWVVIPQASAAGFIDDSTLTGGIYYWQRERDRKDVTDGDKYKTNLSHSTWNANLDFQSGYAADMFGLDIAAFTAIEMAENGDSGHPNEIAFSSRNKAYDEDYSGDKSGISLYKAAAKFKYGPAWARAGYIQPTGQTLLAPHWSFMPGTYQGAEAGANFDYGTAGALSFSYMWTNEYKAPWHIEMDDFYQNDKKTKVDYLHSVGAKYDFKNDLVLEAAFGQAQGYIDQYFAKASYQFYGTRDKVSNGGVNDIYDGTAWLQALTFGYKVADVLDLRLEGTWVKADGQQGYFLQRMTPTYASSNGRLDIWWDNRSDFNANGEKAVFFGAMYDMKNWDMPGWAFGASYVYAWDAKPGKMSSPDAYYDADYRLKESAYSLDALYTVQEGRAKGTLFKLHFTQYDNHSDIPSWSGGYGNIFQDERDVKFMVIAPFTIF